MHLYEYQAKQILKQYGLLVPIGSVCKTSREAEEIASKIGVGPWAVKCQIHAGGRSQAGGVKVVKTKEEVRIFSENWLGKRLITKQTDLQGQLVNQILVEAAIEINQEFYLGVVVDRNLCRVAFMVSNKGGVDIEKVAKETPHLIHKIILDPSTGPQPYQGRELACKMNLYGKQISQFSKVFMKFSTLFLEQDLLFGEINPLVFTKQGDLICLDSKFSIDDNAIFRHPELHAMCDLSQEDPHGALAEHLEFNYVNLGGNIGCIVNGAGLAMGTIDIVRQYGGQPANFLDVRGSVTKASMIKAFKIIISNDAVKAILVNIFGGIVRCDLIADGIISAVSEVEIKIPIVVRFEGNNAELGMRKLLNSKLSVIVATSLIDAVQLVISAVGINDVNLG